MKFLVGLCTCLFLTTRAVRAHGDHGEPLKGETIQQYAQRHVGTSYLELVGSLLTRF